MTVTTPRLYTPGAPYAVDVDATRQLIQADSSGALSFAVDMGPSHQVQQNRFGRLATRGGVVFASGLGGAAVFAEEDKEDFFFVQLTDTHWGFKDDKINPESQNTLKKAIAAGKFEEETVTVPVSFTTPNGSKPKRRQISFKVDEGPRADTSIEALGALKAAFHVKGVTTAGNSSQMSDGAAAAVVMSAERAKALAIAPLARYVAFATAGYKPEEMGLGPVFAIPKALK